MTGRYFSKFFWKFLRNGRVGLPAFAAASILRSRATAKDESAE
jgi:hypothetical protein